MGRVVSGGNGISSGICGGRQYQRFTANGVWKKPIGARLVCLEIIGGGGANFRTTLPAESISNTLTVVVAAAISGPSAETNGSPGNFSSVSDGTFTFKAYGGGAGSQQADVTGGGGGGMGNGDGGGAGGDGARGEVRIWSW